MALSTSTVGSAALRVFPTMKGMKKAIGREADSSIKGAEGRMRKGFSKIGTRSGKEFSKSFSGSWNVGTSELKKLNQDVAKTSKALNAARLKEQDAIGKVRVAEAQLAEARAKHGEGSSQVIRAEERLATVQRRLTVAQDKTASSSESLAKAQKKLANATGVADEAMKGKGFRTFQRNISGLLAPISLVGRSLTGPLRKGLSNFTAGFGDLSVALQRSTGYLGIFGGLSRVAFDGVSGAVQRVSRAVSSRLGSAWQAVSKGAQAAAGAAQRALAPAAKWMEPFTTAVRTSVTSAGRIIKGLGPTFSRVASGARSAWQRGMSAIASASSQVASSVGAAFKATGVVIAGAMTAALTGGWTRMTDIENAQAKLRGLGNSAKDVESIMQSALDSVEGTAFGLGEAANVAATAVAAGIKPGQELTKYLTNVSNAAAAANVPMTEMGQILNKVTTSGRAYTMEINQLADRGLPIWQTLADQYGVTAEELRKMVSDGKVQSADFMKAVQTMSGSVADEMGNTVTGAFRNMRTAFSRLGANILTPLQGTFKALFTAMQKGADAAGAVVVPLFTVIGDKLAGTLVPALESVTAKFVAFKDGMSEVGNLPGLSGLMDLLGDFAPVIGGILGAMAPLLSRLPGIGSLFAGLSGPVGIVVGVLAGLLTQSQALRDAFSGALSAAMAAFGQIVQALAPVMETLGGAVADIAQSLGGALATAITAITPLFGVVADVISQLAPVLGSLIPPIAKIAVALVDGLFSALQPLIPVVVEIAGVLGDALMSSVKALSPILMMLAPIVAQLASTLGTVLGQALQAVAPIITLMVDVVSQLLTALMPLISTVLQLAAPILQLLEPVLALVGEAFGPLADLLVAVLEPALQLIVTVVNALIPVVQGVVEILTGVITFITGVFTGDWGMAWEGIKGIFSGIWNTILAVITGIWEIIKGVFTAALTIITNLWNTVWGGISSFFSGIWNGIVSFFTTIWTNITTAFTTALTFVKGLWTSTWNSVSSFFSNIWNGIKTTVSTIWTNITSAFSTGVSNAVAKVKEIPTKIKNAVTGAGTWLVETGKNIIQGLIDGVGDMIDSAVQAVKDVGGAMMDGIKDFLGIKSPSRRFRFEVGQMVGEGVIEGVDDKRRAVADATQRLVTVPDVPRYGSAAVAALTASGSRSVLPKQLVLRVGDREFTAYVDERADARVARHDSRSDTKVQSRKKKLG